MKNTFQLRIFVLVLSVSYLVSLNKNKNAKLESVFIFEKDCNQSHEGHHLSTQIRMQAPLFFHKKPMRPVIIQESSCD